MNLLVVFDRYTAVLWLDSDGSMQGCCQLTKSQNGGAIHHAVHGIDVQQQMPDCNHNLLRKSAQGAGLAVFPTSKIVLEMSIIIHNTLQQAP